MVLNEGLAEESIKYKTHIYDEKIVWVTFNYLKIIIFKS